VGNQKTKTKKSAATYTEKPHINTRRIVLKCENSSSRRYERFTIAIWFVFFHITSLGSGAIGFKGSTRLRCGIGLVTTNSGVKGDLVTLHFIDGFYYVNFS
jgi:hypothetical protein